MFERSEMVRTKIFLSNKTQAVRLPKAVSLPAGIEEVEITVVGNSRIISPIGESWDEWFAHKGPGDDFLTDREQSKADERESF